MKTTLTQVYEAKGLTGYHLRNAVEFKLAQKFFKEAPEADKQTRRAFVMFMGLGVTTLGLVKWLLFAVPIYTANYSNLNQLVSVFAWFTLIFSIVLGLGLWMLFYIKLCDAVSRRYKVGSVSRFVFQHRDDEVEL